MYVLSQRYASVDNTQIKYQWVTLNHVPVSPFFDLLEDAFVWHRSHIEDLSQGERRASALDRRSGRDRRGRVSMFDRRLIPQGRRATDQVKRYR